jgi:hypothetical protein
VKPGTAGGAGTVIAALHVLATTGAAGAAGKITAFDGGDCIHAIGPAVLAGIEPQAAVKTYLVLIV